MTHDRSPAKPHISVTWAEIVSWTLVIVGALVFLIATASFVSESSSYLGSTAGPMMWMIAGGALATLTLTPALILSGFRVMLERR